MYTSKTGNFIQKYYELLPKTKTADITDEEIFTVCHPSCELAKCIEEDFDERIALELGKVLLALYDR